ncbi:MAG: alkaline phosphatase, partial [Longimicrobiales bacterium]
CFLGFHNRSESSALCALNEDAKDMTRIPTRSLLSASLLLVASCTPQVIHTATVTPNSVIVLIADGAGVSHWTLAAFASDDLAIERMPVGGLVDTRGADHEVTGSAPSASALATGVRTFMGAISVDMDSVPRQTVLEVAHEQGWATGLITTTWLTDATPAAFASHVPSRGQMAEIFRQMIDLPVNVLLGGGSSLLPLAQARLGLDLRTPAMERYTFVETEADLESVSRSDASMVLGFFAEGDMPLAPERSPNLAEMTAAALRVLEKDPDGFFLMVENEGSDTEAHRNASREVITAEMLGFDAAVGVALDYQERHPETLVLVTADHETGGLHLTGNEQREIVVGYATTDHTAALVPLFASGPGAERFAGLKGNDEVGRILIELVRR